MLEKNCLTLRESNIYKYYQEYEKPVNFEDFYQNFNLKAQKEIENG